MKRVDNDEADAAEQHLPFLRSPARRRNRKTNVVAKRPIRMKPPMTPITMSTV